MAVTDVQDAVIRRLEGPASQVESATGRSFHYVTASLYAVSLLLPAESIVRFGGTPVGLATLPLFVGFVMWRMRDALRLARRGPSTSSVRAMSPDRVAPPIVAIRMMWTAVTAVSLGWLAFALATGRHPAGLSLIPFVVALFLALHLHACTPPRPTPRARAVPSAA